MQVSLFLISCEFEFLKVHASFCLRHFMRVSFLGFPCDFVLFDFHASLSLEFHASFYFKSSMRVSCLQRSCEYGCMRVSVLGLSLRVWC